MRKVKTMIEEGASPNMPIGLHEQIDKVLLCNGFEYFDDWEYGPMFGWSEQCDRINLKLFKHAYGYWIIFRRHASGANIEMNIGSSDSAFDIIALRDTLINVADNCLLERVQP